MSKTKLFMPRHFLLSIFSCLLTINGCAVYPTTRTFYEVNPADGTPVNRTSCGYFGTKDAVKRIQNGIEIMIAPGSENLPSELPSTLTTWVFFSNPIHLSKVVINPSKIHAHSGELVWEPKLIDDFDRLSRRSDGTYLWKGIKLTYPAPSGLQNQITFVFQPGALLVNDRTVSVATFRFTRVTKNDVYYGSINC